MDNKESIEQLSMGGPAHQSNGTAVVTTRGKDKVIKKEGGKRKVQYCCKHALCKIFGWSS